MFFAGNLKPDCGQRDMLHNNQPLQNINRYIADEEASRGCSDISEKARRELPADFFTIFYNSDSWQLIISLQVKGAFCSGGTLIKFIPVPLIGEPG